jgi:hypothetical protein
VWKERRARLTTLSLACRLDSHVTNDSSLRCDELRSFPEHTLECILVVAIPREENVQRECVERRVEWARVSERERERVGGCNRDHLTNSLAPSST